MADRPLVIYDGNCGFCRIWVEYGKELAGDRLDWAPSQEVGAEHPQIDSQQYGKSVQLVLPDGTVESGARAVCRIVSMAPGREWALGSYENVPGVAPVEELLYRTIAAHRGLAYQLTRLLWGREVHPAGYAFSETLFLRVLALIYLAAFWSFAVQARGLIGANGILPLAPFLGAVHAAYGGAVWHLAPALFWWNSSDTAIVWLPAAGAIIAAVAAVTSGTARRLAFAALFILYLSVCTAGQDFLSFQWDLLLLEAGFLAIFLGLSPSIRWIAKLLLFRLMFFSGAVKLLSRDPTWRNLTALTFHYHTQPLPTPLAWYADKLPLWFQKDSTVGVFVIELGAPFLIFLPRRLRFIGVALLVLLQVNILLTGNYAFFNLLAIALCLLMLDDRAFRRLRRKSEAGGSVTKTRVAGRRPRRIAAMVAAVLLALNAGHLIALFRGSAPPPLDSLMRFTAPFGIVNSYGLFAVMTTTRPEIIVQGSNDGATWVDYAFRYKPGDLKRSPPWVAPHQPRLDWQMWFAALGDYHSNPWFVNFLVRLLQGSPVVTALLERTPFGKTPPRYVRALLCDYTFTDAATRRRTGEWWRRELKGLYFPPISLEDVRKAQQ